MAEPVVRVELTARFLERLAAVESFLTEADAGAAYDRLLDELRTTVIPHLRRFPRIGRRYLDQPPQSAEALAQLAALPAGAADNINLTFGYKSTINDSAPTDLRMDGFQITLVFGWHPLIEGAKRLKSE